MLPCSLVLLVWLWKISDHDAREKVLQNLEDLNGGAAFDRREVEESATDAQNGNRITEDVDDAGRVELRALSERSYVIGEEHRLERSADVAYGYRAGEGSDTVCVQKGIAVHVSANVQGDLEAKKSDRRVDNRGKYVDFHARANDRSDWEAAKKDRSDDCRWESVDVRTVSRVDNKATAVKEDSNIKEEIRETCGIEGCVCCDFRARQRWDTHLLSSGRGPCVGCQCLFCHER